MKVISLNIWGGLAGKEKLLKFFKDHKDVDVFCLQEIWSSPNGILNGQSVASTRLDMDKIMTYALQDISSVLKRHLAYFKPAYLDHYGLLMLVRKDLEVIAEGDSFVHKERGHIPEGNVGNHARNIQYVTIKTENGLRTILNFHGLWNGQDKGDSDDRLIQSRKAVKFIKTLSVPYILCGDFNLLPDTESLKIIEDSGLRNLIKEYKITSTRTSFYTKPDKFADYALVSGEIKIKDFKVLPDEVSDHRPLYLEFE